VAADLLRAGVDRTATGDPHWEALTGGLARVLLRLGDHTAAEAGARRVLAAPVVDPERAAEMYWVLARALFSAGRNDDALATVQGALQRSALPGPWRARMLASLAMYQRAGAGDLAAAECTAGQALRLGEEAGDAFVVAYALNSLWLIYSVKRDHAGALRCVDRALDLLGSDAGHAELRSLTLDNKVFTLQSLDRLAEADATIREARDLGRRTGTPAGALSCIGNAVYYYWTGQWDDALVELDCVDETGSEITYAGLRERGPALLLHGVAALIAGHRDDRAAAAGHLRAGLDLPVVTVADRENRDFLVAAYALAAEQDADPRRALSTLATILDPRPGQMTLTHQWLPDLVRLAMAVRDPATVHAAVASCRSAAAVEAVPARAAVAARRCDGLLNQDPAALLDAADHYRAVGRPVELANALEDAAVVLADQRRAGDARTAFTEAVEIYTGLGAEWDLRRADSRIRPYGIRRGVRGPRRRPASGWAALTPTEVKVAGLVAEGRSTPDIAKELFLSRRTVQTHISHILAKLDVGSRVAIARAAIHHLPSTRPSGADSDPGPETDPDRDRNPDPDVDPAADRDVDPDPGPGGSSLETKLVP